MVFGVSVLGWLQGALLGADEFLIGQRAKMLLLERVLTDTFSRCDVVVQTSPVPFDILGLPELALPIGFTDEGLPVGAILGGQPFAEDRLLSIAAAYRAVTDWHRRRPADPTLVAARRAPRRLTAEEVGLLDGRRATTHWQFADLLARRRPAVTVDRDVLYVADGPVLTSAGAAAGIDACLHVVRERYGAAVANALARRMVVPAYREGGQAQYVETPVPATGDHTLSGLLDWMREHLAEPLTVEVLAARAHLSPRTFARRFKETTGATPHRWLLDQRLQHAEHLLETTTLPVDVVAARAGFGSGDTLRHHFAARRGVSPHRYRRVFAVL